MYSGSDAFLRVSQLCSEIQKDQLTIGNPNTCAEIKLCLFKPALEIVCCQTEVLDIVSSGEYKWIGLKLLCIDRKKLQSYL